MDSQTGFPGNIGLYSYGLAFLAFLVLITLALNKRRIQPLGKPLLVAAVLSALWAASVLYSLQGSEPSIRLIQITEIARNAAWSLLLFQLIVLRLRESSHPLNERLWLTLLVFGFVSVTAFVLVADPMAASFTLPGNFLTSLSYGLWLGMSVLGFLLLEQYFRNSNEQELWATKHLCLGLGIIFTYDFFMYAEALLFRHMDSNFWRARGFVVGMAAIPMIVSVIRIEQSQDQGGERRFHLSRHVAFHSLTLMASGVYLIFMALAGYFIRYLGGNWGNVLQISFLSASGLMLVMLLFSGRIRAYTRVWLSKNFFSYKYDYRQEWLEFTDALANGDNQVPVNITRAVARLAKSNAGLLLNRTEDGEFTVEANWEMPRPSGQAQLHGLPEWLEQRQWIIDLREWRTSPDLYGNLEIPSWMTKIPGAWLIIPLLLGDRLQGILLLKHSNLVRELNWEDRDLLKVAGRQAASHLAQFQADRALVESRQFEAFNRLSAYVIHDLKNILAQLSLLVANAEKHKQNPAFIDDMVDTIDHSVQRMSRLMMQLRGGDTSPEKELVSLKDLLSSAINECNMRPPQPAFYTDVDESVSTYCDRDRLHAVFVHLIQNAQDATGDNGRVGVRLSTADDWSLIAIEDDGIGMDEEFIRSRLFKPFDSTKGLTGMGIGAFESRDFIRGLGGEISVESNPGAGSVFHVRIPQAAGPAQHTDNSIRVETA
ncbi:MAG: XrtA/PEP-CTERM system histidine kinase PrsK [Pseudomonadota bacterium]